MLCSKRNGRLVCSKEEVDQFLHASLQDPRRDQDLRQQRALVDQLVPEVNFDVREPGLKEIQEVVRAARASSALGPSGVPYKVYKRCPQNNPAHNPAHKSPLLGNASNGYLLKSCGSKGEEACNLQAVYIDLIA